ncbi:MAG: SRPBCC family protein [Candidatus Sulfotelmatobacter sp.]
MPAFSYSVTTKLPRGRVWSLLTDITNWPKFSDMYSDLHWDGTPWAEGSALVGQLNYPIVVSGRYVIRKCDPPVLIRYLSQTRDAGFATERTITLEQLTDGTLIQVEAYVVGRPEMPGGASEFLRSLTTRWFDEFARFCDNQTVSF